MTEPGTLAEEASRLAQAFSDWTHDHSVGLAESAGTSAECRYCPLCQLIAVVRGQRPEVSARLAESAAALLDAVRSLLTSSEAHGAEEDRPPTVQHIDVQ